MQVVDTLEVDAVMVATGRAPYTQGLGLDAIGCETDRRGFVTVNETMNVLDKNGKALSNVFCIGDANGKLMLAHAASAQVRAFLPCSPTSLSVSTSGFALPSASSCTSLCLAPLPC